MWNSLIFDLTLKILKLWFTFCILIHQQCRSFFNIVLVDANRHLSVVSGEAIGSSKVKLKTDGTVGSTGVSSAGTNSIDTITFGITSKDVFLIAVSYP